MAKLVLGAPPKSFKKELKFKLLDGSEGTMEVVYKYRDRDEYAAFMDAQLEKVKAEGDAAIAAAKAEAKARAAAGDDSIDLGMSTVELNATRSAGQADLILGMVEGWNLDQEFGEDSVKLLIAQFPMAATAIIDTYREAIVEGRLGN